MVDVVSMESDEGLCGNCRWLPTYTKDRCEPCYRWLRRKGYDRPNSQIVRYGATERSRQSVAKMWLRRMQSST